MRIEYAALFDDIETVYAINEGDAAGGTLIDRLKASTALEDRLRVVALDGAKDPSDLFLADPDGFRQRFEGALRSVEARPASGHPKMDEEARIANDEGRELGGELDVDEGDDGDGGDDESAQSEGADNKSESPLRKAKKTKAKSQASLLTDLAMKQCDFFHDEFNVAYASLAAPHDGGQHRETHRLKGKSFGFWLRRAYYVSYAAAPSSDAVRTAVTQLESHAIIDGPKRDVYMRTASYGGKIYIDICDDLWRAYEVDAEGWRIVDDPPVYFIRSSSMLPLVEAERGKAKDGIAKLKALTRIRDDEDFVVAVGFLLAALAGRAPFTVIIFLGEPGATKTTHLKTLRMLVDPNRAPVRSPPRDQRDVYISVTKSAMGVFNNLSHLPEWLSDTLCVVTEGSGDSRRELYTDDDESLIFARAPVMLAAVENVVARGDLADRTLYASSRRNWAWSRKAFKRWAGAYFGSSASAFDNNTSARSRSSPGA
jgi:hypothetical protein